MENYHNELSPKKTRKLHSLFNDCDPRKDRIVNGTKRGSRKIDTSALRESLKSKDYMNHAIDKIASELSFPFFQK